MKVGGREIRSAIGHAALGEAALTEHDFDTAVAGWPWQQLILKLSLIDHMRVLLSGEDWNTDHLLLHKFLREELRGPASEILSRGAIIANQAAIAYLVLQTLRLASDAPDRGDDDHADFADILLAANDVLYPNGDSPDPTQEGLEQLLATLILVNATSGDPDPPRYLLPRYYHLFGELAAANQGKPGAVDISAVVEDLTGATLAQVFGSCLAAYGFFIGLANRAKDAWAKGGNSPVTASDFILPRKTYLKNLNIQDGGATLVNHFSTNPDQFGGTQLRSAYDFEHLKRRPIVSLDEDRMAIPIVEFLFDRATIMLWWDIHNKVPPEQQNAFESWWGYLTQEYVYQLLERALGPPGGALKQWIREDQYELTSDAARSPDAVVIGHGNDGLALAFIEVKSSRPKYVDLVTGDVDALRAHWRSRLIGDVGKPKAARQIDSAITAFHAGTLKLGGVDPAAVQRVFPVVVTLDHWPLRSILYDRFVEDITGEGLLSQENTAPVEVLSCDELEMLVGKAENGESMVGILDQRRLESVQSIPIRDWVNNAPSPSLLNEVWDRMSPESEMGFGRGQSSKER